MFIVIVIVIVTKADAAAIREIFHLEGELSRPSRCGGDSR
jgi:hypothetical protein